MSYCELKHLANGQWLCMVCGWSGSSRLYDKAENAGRKIHRKCQGRLQNASRFLAVPNSEPCTFATILSLITPEGVDRLQRCREAKCGLMLPVEGTMTCTGMGGGKCGWTQKWASRLNGESAFPNGTIDCPHWKSDHEERIPEHLEEQEPEDGQQEHGGTVLGHEPAGHFESSSSPDANEAMLSKSPSENQIPLTGQFKSLDKSGTSLHRCGGTETDPARSSVLNVPSHPEARI